MSKKEKVTISLSIDKKLNNYVNELIENRSKYIEWLVYQELMKNNVELKGIIV